MKELVDKVLTGGDIAAMGRMLNIMVIGVIVLFVVKAYSRTDKSISWLMSGIGLSLICVSRCTPLAVHVHKAMTVSIQVR